MRCVHGVCNYINRFSFLISWLYKLYILDIEHWFTVSTCRCIGSRYNKLHEHLWVSIHGTVILLGLMISGWDSVVCRVGTVTNVCYYKVTKWCLLLIYKSSLQVLYSLHGAAQAQRTGHPEDFWHWKVKESSGNESQC